MPIFTQMDETRVVDRGGCFESTPLPKWRHLAECMATQTPADESPCRITLLVVDGSHQVGHVTLMRGTPKHGQRVARRRWKMHASVDCWTSKTSKVIETASMGSYLPLIGRTFEPPLSPKAALAVALSDAECAEDCTTVLKFRNADDTEDVFVYTPACSMGTNTLLMGETDYIML
jgi:hypothetical protein